MDTSNAGEWFNIPEVVCDKLATIEKRLNFHETRADKLETITARLSRENEQLLAENRRLNERIGELTLQMNSPDEAFIEGLRTRLQNCINPEFFKPILERQLSCMKATFEDEFEKVYALLDQKVSGDRVAESLAVHFNEVAGETQKFTARLQDVLRSKADTARVNEILQLKADASSVKEHVERAVAVQMRQERESLQTQLGVLPDPCDVRRLQTGLQELSKEFQTETTALKRVFQQQQTQLQELRVETKANTQQLAAQGASAEELLRLERQMKGGQDSALRRVVEPLVTAQEQLRKRLQIVEAAAERKRFAVQ